MLRHIHWLKICGSVSPQDEARQYREIQNYLKHYPDATASIYYYNYVLLDKAVKLECNQNWRDLDLDANTGSHQLKRLVRKPSNISNPLPFTVPEWLQQEISRLNERNHNMEQYDAPCDCQYPNLHL